MGGTCVIRGCVPKKLMTYASAFRDHFEDAAGYGWTVEAAQFDWARFIAGKDREIARLEGIYGDILRRAGVEVFATRAVLVDPHRVRLASGEERTARHILIATGGHPFVPGIPGADLGITSNDIFHLAEQPRRMLIVGGGYVACEFAGIMNGLGTEVTLVYRGGQVLRGFDDEVRAHVAEAMRARGIRIETGHDLVAIEHTPGGLAARLESGAVHETDAVLFATGRNASTAGLGLEEIGVALAADGSVVVDDWSQTSVPSIYAIGDVTGRIALTPVAIREGHSFADTVFGGRPRRVDHSLIATAVFTRPEVGTVGLSEGEARATGEVEIYRTRFRPMFNILAGRDERMLMKLVVAKGSRRVLGCHIVGEGAGEMVQLAAIAMGMGATKEDFDRTMAVHPTAAEELVTMRTAAA
jgi:glutathione reductase (NADPH)